MNFADIKGQEKPVRILRRALKNGTLAHAYLFSGETGIGKRTTALAVAGAANCLNAGENGGCGSCPSCRKVAAGTHPDIHLLMPDGDEIKIDQVREIQADLALKPFEGEKKVLIVDGADAMNAASANAFLKTLEEPPGDTVIFLLTAIPQSLLPTIRSRCQEIRFQPLARNTLAAMLTEKRSLTGENAWFLAALAQGSMGRALEMDADREKADRAEMIELWSKLPHMGPGEVLALSEGYARDRERFDRMISVGIECLRDALVYHETEDARLLVNEQAAEQYRLRGLQVSVPRMLADLDALTVSRSMLDRRVSAQLVAENLLFRLAEG